MKWKNPDGKKFSTVGVTVGGLLLGAMVSDGIVSFIHTPKATAGTEEAKKEANMLLIKRGAVAVGAGYAGAGIDGNDNTSVFVKSACYGAATKQGLSIVYGVAKTQPKLADTSTPVKRAIAATFGLACPGDAPLMGTKRRRTGMKGMGVFIPNPNNGSKERILNSY